MSISELDKIIPRLKQSLLLPFTIVVLSIAIIIALLFVTSSRLNKVAETAKIDLMKTVLNSDADGLKTLARDYSWWDEATTNLVVKPNPDWIDANLTSYMENSFDVTRVIVFTPDHEIITSVYESNVIPGEAKELINEDVHALLKVASKADASAPAPQSAFGYVRFKRTLYATSVHPFLAEENNKLYEPDKIYGYLLVAKPIDGKQLDVWAEDYGFANMGLHHTSDHSPVDHAHVVLSSPTGKILADISFDPDKPGDSYLDEMIPWVVLLLIVITAVSVYFVRRVVAYSAMTVESIAELNKTQEKLNELAYYDPLTGLANRTLAIDRLTQAIATSKRLGMQFALLYIDLDAFKLINDTKGHHAGDLLLQAVANRMQETIREEDTLARMSGDEFCMIMPNIKSPMDANTVADKINVSLASPYIIDGDEVYIACSIGIVVSPSDGMNAHELLTKADMAMYHAKELGRNRSHFFTEELNERIQSIAKIRFQLRNSIQNHELSLAYQPVINIESGAIIGAEALLRWDNKDLGAVSPDRFVPIAEESGMIEQLGSWVIDKVLNDGERIKGRYGCNFHVSINVSSRQMLDKDFFGEIEKLGRRKIDCLPQINIEITENALLEDNANVRECLSRISDYGVGISIDDFGTGYSSLAYLNKHDVDFVKIDRSFVGDINVNPKAEQLILAIIDIAKNLEIGAIAEGVETEAQRDFLKSNGCEIVQGFLYSQPVSLDELLEYQD